MALVEYRRLLGFRRVPVGTPRPAVFTRLAPGRCHSGHMCCYHVDGTR